MKKFLVCVLLLSAFIALSSAAENKKWLLNKGKPLRIRKTEETPALLENQNQWFRAQLWKEFTSKRARKNEQAPALLENQKGIWGRPFSQSTEWTSSCSRRKPKGMVWQLNSQQKKE